MCKEWTKLFNETNLLHLDDYKGVKEKYNEDRVGISGVVEIDGDWITLHPLTYCRAFGLSSQQWRNPEKINLITN